MLILQIINSTGLIIVILLVLKLHRGQRRIMSDVTDLQAKFDAAVAATSKAITDASAKIDALVAALSSNPDPAELAAFKADVSTQSDALNAAAAALEAKVTPPTA